MILLLSWSDTGYKFHYPAITSDFIFLKLLDNTFEKNNNESDWIKLIKQKETELFSAGKEKINHSILQL